MNSGSEYLIEYYNKFNEDKRLLSRHGQVEYVITMRHLNEYLESLESQKSDIKILDIGAGTGAYSGPLSEKGYDVSAIELVKHNMSRLKVKYPLVNGRVGDALNLKKYESNYFDVTLLFGPMYHLFGPENKIQALKEAQRVTKNNGRIYVAYCMNEYSILTYGFKEHHIIESFAENKVDSDFHVRNSEQDLYDYLRIEDINELNDKVGLKRLDIFSPDGPSNMMREILKQMSEEEFQCFLNYQYRVSRRKDLLGAGGHIVDVLGKAD